MRAAVAAALLVLLLGLAWPAFGPGRAAAPAADGGPFAATHFDSVPVDVFDGADGYREVWCVTRVPEGWRSGNVTATLDGQPVQLVWTPAGPVQAHATFSFFAVERDPVRKLEVAHGGSVVWRTEFGTGTGTPIGCGR